MCDTHGGVWVEASGTVSCSVRAETSMEAMYVSVCRSTLRPASRAAALRARSSVVDRGACACDSLRVFCTRTRVRWRRRRRPRRARNDADDADDGGCESSPTALGVFGAELARAGGRERARGRCGCATGVRACGGGARGDGARGGGACKCWGGFGEGDHGAGARRSRGGWVWNGAVRERVVRWVCGGRT